MRSFVLSLSLFLVSACGGSGGGPAGLYGRCISNDEVCQFQRGVSTTAQVQAALGPPQQKQTAGSGSGSMQTWLYVCMPDAQSIYEVGFFFDANGVLVEFLVNRVGPNPPPAPTC
jgi:hypothetical protein